MTLDSNISLNNEERYCDQMARNVLFSIGNDKVAIGGYLVTLLISVYDNSVAAFGKNTDDSKYPAVSERLSAYHFDIFNESLYAGIDFSPNLFDFVLTKWIEIDFYEREAKKIISHRVSIFLSTYHVKYEMLQSTAREICEHCCCIPALGQQIQLSTIIRKKDGGLIQKITFNLDQFRLFIQILEQFFSVSFDEIHMIDLAFEIIELLEESEIPQKSLSIEIAKKVWPNQALILYSDLLKSHSSSALSTSLNWLHSKGFVNSTEGSIGFGYMQSLNIELSIS